MLLTYKYRIKDSAARRKLNALSISVNQVWNYCGNIHNDSRRLNRHWPSYVDLAKLVAGSGAELGLHSDTLQDICRYWVRARDMIRRRPRWRGSFGSKRSLGWVPFQSARAIRISGDVVTYYGHRFRLWLHRPIPENVRSGSFSQDSTGRWYLNLSCEVPAGLPTGAGEVGIDLGLKDLATLSTGEKIANPRHLRKTAARLARAQRAGRKRLARSINRKIAAQRRHFLHIQSARLAREYSLIVVGDVDSTRLARSKMAKSIYDAGWTTLRSMLRYKAMRHGAVFVEADERHSTLACSACGSIGGPRGLEGLRVRTWECDDCGALHDRDVNAALNILSSGRNAALHLTGNPVL